MTLYLDASALVKRYVEERGSELILTPPEGVIGTSLISRAEVVAAFARATRVGILTREGAEQARDAFRSDWPSLVRIPVSGSLIERADRLAWAHGLRGYDSVQLASALEWRSHLASPVTFATFDRRLWEAARLEALDPYPTDLPTLLDSWKSP